MAQNNNFKEIYDNSIKNPEKFWKKFPLMCFGLRNQQKF